MTRELGFKSVRECQETITSAEFVEHVAYFLAFPWSHGHAMIAATLAELHRDKKNRSEPFIYRDFMPGLRRVDEDEADDGEELFKRLKVFHSNG